MKSKTIPFTQITLPVVALVLASTLLASGCSTKSSFQREQRDLTAQTETNDRQYANAKTLQDIENLKPQAQFPLRLVIPQPNDGRAWTQAELAEMESWRPALQATGYISELFVLPESSDYAAIQDEACEQPWRVCAQASKRLMAARFQADALLNLNPVSQTNSGMNPLSVLNLSIVGMWLVPGHYRETQVNIEGALVDVRNGYIYAFTRAFGEASKTRPLAYVDDCDVETEARLRALQNFGKKLLADVQAQAQSKS